MKALILAAGKGTRLAPISDNIPKAMVPVNGTPILVKQVENLLKNGIRQIAVVVGHQGAVIKELIKERYSFIHIIENLDYSRTNNMYSACLAKDWIRQSPFIMMNGDVFLDSSIIREVLENDEPNLVCVDKGRYMEESMKVREQNGRLIEIAKTIPEELALGVSIDVYKFSDTAGDTFFHKCSEYILEKCNSGLWSEVAINDSFKLHRFAPCFISGRWWEIDTLEDLASAEAIFS